MDTKTTRWDYIVTVIMLLTVGTWAYFEWKETPDKIPFEPLAAALGYVFMLLGFLFFKRITNKETTEQSHTRVQRAEKIWNIGSVSTANISVLFSGGRYIALAFLLVIAIWQKNEIQELLGFDRFFSKKDDNFKILVLPFKQICLYNGKNYDAGLVVTERLNDIIAEQQLNIKVHYWADYDFKKFNDAEAENLRAYHRADMILFGSYETAACSAEGEQVCLNYITDQKWNLGDAGVNLSRDYQQGGITELRTGKIQEKVEDLAILISLIAQAKGINHKTYLKKLQETLEEEDFGSTARAHIYLEIADVLKEEGKLEELIVHYEKALEIFLKNGEFEDVGICYQRIGSTYADLGNLDKALAFYKEYNRLAAELYAAYPNNVDFKNGLAISYSKLGETHSSLGNLDKALDFFEEYNRLKKELYAAYPNNVGFKNGLAISYSKLGETHSSLGNLDKALDFNEKANQTIKALYTAYPNTVDFKNGLAISYSKLGETHSSLGNLDKALAFFEEYNKLEKELYAAYPNNVGFKNGLAISYSKLGRLYLNSDKAKAKAYFLECKKLWVELTRAFPAYVEFQKNLQWVEEVLKALE